MCCDTDRSKSVDSVDACEVFVSGGDSEVHGKMASEGGNLASTFRLGQYSCSLSA
ncbi:hypothetical protein DPMN_097628 [Dreissena polymorpha]|uniref:Uncharacterized protein n=1 Tax=Dreissena polymorpha TaxID=45954 RepID=A0A9D4LAU5_DREPO|nr:hypothetical protein DPMN_097628 [Dreissena polymorpha]